MNRGIIYQRDWISEKNKTKSRAEDSVNKMKNALEHIGTRAEYMEELVSSKIEILKGYSYKRKEIKINLPKLALAVFAALIIWWVDVNRKFAI